MRNEKTRQPHPLLEGLSDQEALALCGQLRRDLVQSVSETGGHLASNLGAVELTVAIHRVFDTSVDRLIFDVGHRYGCAASRPSCSYYEDVDVKSHGVSPSLSAQISERVCG